MLSTQIKFYPGPGGLRFSPTQEAKILSGAKVLEKGVNHSNFRKYVEHYKWNKNGQLQTRFHLSRNRVNKTIFRQIMSGRDLFHSAVDGRLDFELAPFRQDSNVIGRTSEQAPGIFFNLKFLDDPSFTIFHVAGNLLHEYLHNLGFGHDKIVNGRVYRVHHWRHTVPYACGNFMILAARSSHPENKALARLSDDYFLSPWLIDIHGEADTHIITYEELEGQHRILTTNREELLLNLDMNRKSNQDKIKGVESRIQQLEKIMRKIQ